MCFNMCARGAGTHGDDLNIHTGTFWVDTRGFSRCHTPHRTHTPQHKTTTQHNTTTRPQHHTEKERETDRYRDRERRQGQREDGRGETREEKTKEDKTRRRRDKTRMQREERRWNTRQETRRRRERRWKRKWRERWNEVKKLFLKNVWEPSNPPDELAQHVSKKSFRTNYSSIFLRKFRIWPFIQLFTWFEFYFFRAGRLISETFFGRMGGSENLQKSWQRCTRRTFIRRYLGRKTKVWKGLEIMLKILKDLWDQWGQDQTIPKQYEGFVKSNGTLKKLVTRSTLQFVQAYKFYTYQDNSSRFQWTWSVDSWSHNWLGVVVLFWIVNNRCFFKDFVYRQ